MNHYRWNLNQRRVSLPFRTWAHSLWYWNAIDSKLSIIPIFENCKLFSFQIAKANRNKISPHTTEPRGNVVNTVSVRNMPRARRFLMPRWWKNTRTENKNSDWSTKCQLSQWEQVELYGFGLMVQTHPCFRLASDVFSSLPCPDFLLLPSLTQQNVWFASVFFHGLTDFVGFVRTFL